MHHRCKSQQSPNRVMPPLAVTLTSLSHELKLSHRMHKYEIRDKRDPCCLDSFQTYVEIL